MEATMKLAIKGGQPIRKKSFTPWPYFDEEEKKMLSNVVDSGQWWRVTGKYVKQFESEFAAFHHSPYAIAVTNGTHALEVALMTIGIQPGDEVIVPALTFIATSMAVQRVGAKAIPVDINSKDYCIDLDAIEKAITDKTKAIIPVHMAGHVVDMKSLQAIAEKNNLIILQDAAHAHGAVRDQSKLGDWKTIACFSFQNFKLMTAGEGGIILFPNEELREKAYLHHNCGRPEFDKAYKHEVLGSTYRMNEFSAAVLLVQLTRLAQQNVCRHTHAKLFRELVKANINHISIQEEHPNVSTHPYYMLMITIDNIDLANHRDFIVQALNKEGIPAFRNYPCVYQTNSFYDHSSSDKKPEDWSKRCPNAEKISNNGLWIHHRVLLGDEEDVHDTVNALQKVVQALI